MGQTPQLSESKTLAKRGAKNDLIIKITEGKRENYSNKHIIQHRLGSLHPTVHHFTTYEFSHHTTPHHFIAHYSVTLHFTPHHIKHNTPHHHTPGPLTSHHNTLGG